MEGLLTCVEKIELDLAHITDVDDLRLLQIRIAALYDKAAEAARATRTCPGPYWREQQQQHQEKKRRRQQTCNNHFTKFYIGPPRTGGSGTQQVLCDACGQIWARDKKKK
jgi:hypothetical protein